MELHLTIPGSIRSKKNHKQPVPLPSKSKTGIRALFYKKWDFARIILIPSKAYKKWEDEARSELLKQVGILTEKINIPISIEAKFYYKGPRPDLSGAMESLGDCLESVIYENDRLIESWDGSRMIHDKINPRTEIIIRDMQREVQTLPLFNK